MGEGWTQVAFSLGLSPNKGLSAVADLIFFPLLAKPPMRKRMRLLKKACEGQSYGGSGGPTNSWS